MPRMKSNVGSQKAAVEVTAAVSEFHRSGSSLSFKVEIKHPENFLGLLEMMEMFSPGLVNAEESFREALESACLNLKGELVELHAHFEAVARDLKARRGKIVKMPKKPGRNSSRNVSDSAKRVDDSEMMIGRVLEQVPA